MKVAVVLPVLAAMTASCVTYPRLQYYDGWTISDRYTTVSETPDGYYMETGHLLVSGNAAVLLVERTDDPNFFGIDDETHHTVRVEIPRPPRVGVVATLRAYHQACPIFGKCEEAALIRGRVWIRKVDATSVDADLDLEFPHLHLKKAATFTKATPNKKWDTEPAR